MTDEYVCQVTHKSPLLGDVGSGVAWSEDRELLLLTRSVELCRVGGTSRFDRTDMRNIPHNVLTLRALPQWKSFRSKPVSTMFWKYIPPRI